MIPYPISDRVLRLPSMEVLLLQGGSGGGNTITFAFLVEREKI